MKTPTSAAASPAKKTTRKTTARAVSLALPLPEVPTTWTRAAKDQGYASVEAWAAAWLDMLAWPGNRLSVAASTSQFRQWCAASRYHEGGLLQWIEDTLDAASEAKTQPTAES